MQKYSKSQSGIVKKTNDYSARNDDLRAECLRINEHYALQPRRLDCKNCLGKLGEAEFASFGCSYAMCPRCGHLNGLFEDTEAFLEHLYNESGGANYGNDFDTDYDDRCRDIYLPKLEFLLQVLQESPVSSSATNSPTVLDVGCGAGHFIRACELKGIQAAGLETSASLIELSRRQLRHSTVDYCSIEGIYSAIESSSRDVTSMIGVLEHLREPRRALQAFVESRASALFISVPLFSLSAFIEHAHGDVFPRQLGGAHTHLYTEESLRYMAEEFGLAIVGEWWFGADMQDIFRTLVVKSSDRNSPRYFEALSKYFRNHLDELQAVLDRNRCCSEVHMVFRRKQDKWRDT